MNGITLFLGGDYQFTVGVEHDFFKIFLNQDGRRVVKEGWTFKLNSVIQEKLHLPCILGYRRAKYRAEDIATSDGYCREKLCLIKISSNLPHHSNKLTVIVENYDPEIIHDVKPRRILRDQKAQLIENLKGQSAYAVRNQLAEELLTEEHCNPGEIPTLNALRVLKSRSQTPANKQNAVISLYDLRNIHLNSIQRIELYPFAAQYSLPSQISWYKNEFRGKKRSTISLDASGFGLVSPTDLKKYIFLYVICAHGKHLVSSCIFYCYRIFYCYIRFQCSELSRDMNGKYTHE